MSLVDGYQGGKFTIFSQARSRLRTNAFEAILLQFHARHWFDFYACSNSK